MLIFNRSSWFLCLSKTNLKSQQANEIDEIFKGLKQKPGFKAYIVLNHDGVVLRWDNNRGKLHYDTAVHYSHHVLELYEMIICQIKDLFNPEDNEVESIRLRTNGHELIAAKEGKYILVVLCDGFTSSKQEGNDDDLIDTNTTKINNF